ncbi:hypothetical protein [Shewanella canadensis]|nr:hypothetical protein [Shewanella canadensis]
MISSCFKYSLLLFVVTPSLSLADKARFSDFCLSMAGQWQGTSAKLKQKPIQTYVSAICSADRRQLMLSVSRRAKHPFSETWWFRERGESTFLIYFDGVDEDKSQSFSLYQQHGSFSLLGEGELNKRPALIQLRFEPKETGWLWLQNVQYLDDDTDRYLFYRGIEMMPVEH